MVIASLSPAKRQNTATAKQERHNTTTLASSEMPKCKPSADKKKQNLVNTHDDLIDVLKLSVLSGLSFYIYCRHKWCMTMGSLLAPPEMILPCETQCYIYDGSYKKSYCLLFIVRPLISWRAGVSTTKCQLI